MTGPVPSHGRVVGGLQEHTGHRKGNRDALASGGTGDGCKEKGTVRVAPGCDMDSGITTKDEVGSAVGRRFHRLEARGRGGGKAQRQAIPGEGEIPDRVRLEKGKGRVTTGESCVTDVPRKAVGKKAECEKHYHEPPVNCGDDCGTSRRFGHRRILSGGLERFNEARYYGARS